MGMTLKLWSSLDTHPVLMVLVPMEREHGEQGIGTKFALSGLFYFSKTDFQNGLPCVRSYAARVLRVCTPILAETRLGQVMTLRLRRCFNGSPSDLIFGPLCRGHGEEYKHTKIPFIEQLYVS